MPGGRPSKLTPTVQRLICDAIAIGNTRHDAAEYAGVGLTTLKRWIGQGKRQRRGQFRTLLDAIKKAEADAVVSSVGRIRQAAKGGQVLKHKVTTKPDGTVTEEKVLTQGQWTADAWWLERKNPKDWGKVEERMTTLEKKVKRLEENKK